MAEADGEATGTAEKHQDFRVNVRCKSVVINQLAKYKSLFINLLERQPELSESDVQKMLAEIVSNFEIAAQENVSVCGLSWDEAAEENREEYDYSTMDDLLDEKIVQTSWTRSVYPKKILHHFVRSLKAERKLMAMFESTIQPQDLKRDLSQDPIMSSVSAVASQNFRQASAVMMSLKDVKQKAEGLHQVLSTQPSAETLEAYRDVLSHSNVRCTSESVYRHSIRRAVSEKDYSMPYTRHST